MTDKEIAVLQAVCHSGLFEKRLDPEKNDGSLLPPMDAPTAWKLPNERVVRLADVVVRRAHAPPLPLSLPALFHRSPRNVPS